MNYLEFGSRFMSLQQNSRTRGTTLHAHMGDDHNDRDREQARRVFLLQVPVSVSHETHQQKSLSITRRLFPLWNRDQRRRMWMNGSQASSSFSPKSSKEESATPDCAEGGADFVLDRKSEHLARLMRHVELPPIVSRTFSVRPSELNRLVAGCTSAEATRALDNLLLGNGNDVDVDGVEL
jgi:hypothetical protein